MSYEGKITNAISQELTQFNRIDESYTLRITLLNFPTINLDLDAYPSRHSNSAQLSAKFRCPLRWSVTPFTTQRDATRTSLLCWYNLYDTFDDAQEVERLENNHAIWITFVTIIQNLDIGNHFLEHRVSHEGGSKQTTWLSNPEYVCYCHCVMFPLQF